MRNSRFFHIPTQAFWIKPDNIEETAAEELEIDEVKLTEASDKSLLLLASTEIQREIESPERYNCPIWTMGLECMITDCDCVKSLLQLSYEFFDQIKQRQSNDSKKLKK